jgi:hypothetical protein
MIVSSNLLAVSSVLRGMMSSCGLVDANNHQKGVT